MTRSRAPSPIPEEKSPSEPEVENSIEIPSEYDPDYENEHDLKSIPPHYNYSMRPSSMPLSTDDLFSRRITPLGVYYPKDRLRHERQFVNCVMELIEKKAYEEEKEEKKEEEKVEIKEEEKVEEKVEEEKVEKKKVTIVDQIKSPPASIKPLRIKNPDALLPLHEESEDYRADLNAPKTPANVRGNRSILHKVGYCIGCHYRQFCVQRRKHGHSWTPTRIIHQRLHIM